MEQLPILVVFDIDETLLQFMGGTTYHFLEEISYEDRKVHLFLSMVRKI